MTIFFNNIQGYCFLRPLLFESTAFYFQTKNITKHVACIALLLSAFNGYLDSIDCKKRVSYTSVSKPYVSKDHIHLMHNSLNAEEFCNERVSLNNHYCQICYIIDSSTTLKNLH